MGKTKKAQKKSYALADSEYIGTDSDPAHAPGHKKVNLRGPSSKNSFSASTKEISSAKKIKRTPRRIITGAALGKTGQISIK